MLYIDLLLSFILFALGIMLIIRKRTGAGNLWRIILALIFFPIALYTYYFPESNPVLFGSITALQVLEYPFIKIILLLAIVGYIARSRRG